MAQNQILSGSIGSYLRQVLKPPVFEDEEKTRIAMVLGIILWALVAVVGTLIITWLATGRSHDLGPYAFIANSLIILFAIGLLFMIRSGYVQIAGLSLIIFLWANITFQAFTSDGVRGSAAIIYLTIMVLAALLLGWRSSVGLGVLSTLAIWLLAHAEKIGYTHFQLDEPYEVALESTGTFVLTAVFLTLATTGLSNALKRARTSEQSLKESNLALKLNLDELKQRGQALLDSEERFRLLAENVVDTIWILDPENRRVIYVSPSVESIIGYAPEEMTGLRIEKILPPESKKLSKEFLAHELERCKKDPTRFSRGELEVYHQNGSTVWVETTARVLYINWLSSYGIIGVTRDISERKASELERRTLQDQLLQSQKMKAIGTLAGGIAHDFNNSLQAILGYTQILIFEKEETDPDLKLLRQIEKSAKRSSELTKQLLTFSRKMESRLRPLDLNQEVKQLEQMLERTIPKMIAIETQLSDNLKIINGDPVQIEQIIMNICINARDAMPDGGKLTIACRNTVLDQTYCNAHVGASPGEFVQLTISDTGDGIDPQTLEHIFEPFFTTKSAGEGTGLGLAMVYGIIKNHNGYVTCDSVPGRGTTFNVYFPIIRDTELRSTDRYNRKRGPATGWETVLLVDDEDYLLELGNHLLTRFGYNVLTAPDGETAIQIYREHKQQIDLIILDLIMPGIGGKNCLDQILAMDPSARVIIASGYSVDDATRVELERKAKGYIKKPFEYTEILNMVRGLLDGDLQ
jgi:PAS domain S-box-containing protein